MEGCMETAWRPHGGDTKTAAEAAQNPAAPRGANAHSPFNGRAGLRRPSAPHGPLRPVLCTVSRNCWMIGAYAGLDVSLLMRISRTPPVIGAMYI